MYCHATDRGLITNNLDISHDSRDRSIKLNVQ